MNAKWEENEARKGLMGASRSSKNLEGEQERWHRREGRG
jgi:hypothetical protein